MLALPPQKELIRSRTDPEQYLEAFEEDNDLSSREFLSIKNLDIYFNDIYLYHKNGGFWNIIYSKISNLIILAFTISFSVFLIGFINWHSVIQCGNKNQCTDIQLIENNLMKNTLFAFIVIIYTIVFIFYFIWHLLNFIISLSSLNITSKFYAQRLKITDDKLKHIEWSYIMNKIVSLQETIRLYHNKHLDALDITNRILRKENYMIAFINKGVLDFTMPNLSEKLLCWTFKYENRQNTNDDILRTDMKQFAQKQQQQQQHKKKKKRNNNNKKKYNVVDDTNNSNRHLLASISPSSEESSNHQKKTQKKRNKIGLKHIKSKIKKIKFNDKRKGYQHVGVIDDDEDEDEDDMSDISDVSDIIDGVGHEYINKNTSNTNEDRLFFEDYMKQKLDDEDDADDDEYNEGSKGYLGNILEWNVRYIIFESMFDDEMKVRDDFKSNSSKLKWRFFWYGIGNLLLTPFTLVFRIIFFFLQNAEEMHSNKGELFSFRQWTTIAKLKFREFNELPHDFEKRMSLSIKPSTEYIDSFAKPAHILILSELISYISGSIVAVLLLLTFIDSSILLNIELFNRSLVWFLAIFSALLAIARSNIIYNDPASNYEGTMNLIARHTHYFPKYWQTNCHQIYIRDQFMSLYPPKFYLFIHELLNVFTTPFILMFTLPNCVDKLLSFINKYTDHIDGVGDICSYSRFDFQRFQNQFVVKQIEKSQQISKQPQDLKDLKDLELLSPIDNRQSSNVSSSTSSTMTPTTTTTTTTTADIHSETLHNKKLESSFLTFAINNPNWRGDTYQSVVLQGLIHPHPHPHSQETKINKKLPSISTAQLGLTFSELLSYDPQNLMHSNMMSIDKIPNPPNLFNTLQRFNDNNDGLSEINESQSAHSVLEEEPEQDDGDDDDDDVDIRPYKTLSMEAK